VLFKLPVVKNLLVGLGNIGARYYGNRHNIGFRVLDFIAHQQEVNFKVERLGAVAAFNYRGREVFLLKPTTYMNRSGEAVRYWGQKLKVGLSRTLVIADDVYLEVGVGRIRSKGGCGGHNGLRNIEAVVQSADYPRLRFGVGDHFPRGWLADYVLQDFTEQESEVVMERIPYFAEIALAFCIQPLDVVMYRYNSKGWGLVNGAES